MKTVLMKNGRVFDGEAFLDADVLIKDGVIEKIEHGITDDADAVYDASGMTVTAGLIDLHTHLKGLSPDSFGTDAAYATFPFGVTAACDAGSFQGDCNYAHSLPVRSYVYVGIPFRENRAVLKGLEEKLARYGDTVVGVKVYFDKSAGNVSDITPLEEVCREAHRRGLPLMVHTASTPAPMLEIAKTLGKGDIITHVYHGGSHNCAEDDFLSLKVARARGVYLDLGMAGHVHTDFAVLRAATAAGYFPDTVSSDITSLSAHTRGGDFGLLMCMSVLRALGMKEEALFRAVTKTPARVLGKKDTLGALKVGGTADVSILQWSDFPYALTNRSGASVSGTTGYVCRLTMVNGKIVYHGGIEPSKRSTP